MTDTFSRRLLAIVADLASASGATHHHHELHNLRRLLDGEPEHVRTGDPHADPNRRPYTGPPAVAEVMINNMSVAESAALIGAAIAAQKAGSK